MNILFVDGWNVHVMEKRFGCKMNYRQLFDVVGSSESNPTLAWYYAGVVTSEPSQPQQQLLKQVEDIGYHVVRREVRKVTGKYHRGGVDVQLAIDAVDRCQRLVDSQKSHESICNCKFVLVSGDGMFAPLIERIGKMGITTVVASAEDAGAIRDDDHFTNVELKEKSDVFVNILENGTLQPKNRAWIAA
jgi:uncharacterized LabA/DUF88 family protein